MKPYILCLILLMLLSGCSSKPGKQPVGDPQAYDSLINKAASRYNLDARLVKAIISVESGFNPTAVSSSNAVGLMQLKPDTAGCDAYRIKGKRGCPSKKDLLDAATNIDLGSAYLGMIQNQQFASVADPTTQRYATAVAYVNGTGALLRTFSSDRQQAVAMISRLSPDQFYWHVMNKHPAAQAPRYLQKIKLAYERF